MALALRCVGVRRLEVERLRLELLRLEVERLRLLLVFWAIWLCFSPFEGLGPLARVAY